MSDSTDRSLIDWVAREIEVTIAACRALLDAGDVDDADNGLFGVAREDFDRICEMLHQVHGAVRMLELPTAEALGAALEHAALALRDQRVEAPDVIAQQFMQGMLELPALLRQAQHEGRHSITATPDIVLDLQRGLGLTVSAQTAGPLQQPDLSIIAGPAPESVIERFIEVDGQNLAHRIRAGFQLVLLNILRRREPARTAVQLLKIGNVLQRVCRGAPLEQLWLLFSAFLNAVNHHGSLQRQSVTLMRRVDTELKRLATDGADALRADVPEDLVLELIDQIQSLGVRNDQIDRVLRAFGLHSTDHAGATVEREARTGVAKVLVEELGETMDQLDMFVRSELRNMADLDALLPRMRRMANIMAVANMGMLEQHVRDQHLEFEISVSQGRINDTQLAEAATVLAQVEEDLKIIAGLAAPGASLQDARFAVVREARVGLDEVKQSLSDFIASRWDHSHLETSGGILKSVRGGLEMVPLVRAARLLDGCIEYLEQDLLERRVVPEWQMMDQLADAITSIDYYLERMLEDRGRTDETILDVAADSVDQLGYAVPDDLAPPAPSSQEETAGRSADALGESVDHLTEPSLSPDELLDDALMFSQSEAAAEPELEDPTLSRFDVDADGEVASPAVDILRAAGLAPEVEDVDALDDPLQLGDLDELGDLKETGYLDEFGEPSDARAPSATIDPADNNLPEVNWLEADAVGELADGGSFAPDADDFGFDFANDAEPDQADVDDDALVDAGAYLDANAEESLGVDASSLLEPETDFEFDVDTTSDVVAAPASATSAATSVPEALPLEEPLDADVLEVFVEEVEEVCAGFDAVWDQWCADPGALAPLETIRRGFHTIKGGGRMVGANTLAELCWSVEHLLNGVLDGMQDGSSAHVDIVDQARALIPALMDGFARSEVPFVMPGALQAIKQAAADLAVGVSTGTDVDDAVDTPAAVVAEAADFDADTVGFDADLTAEVPDVPSVLASDDDIALIEIFRQEAATTFAWLRAHAEGRAGGAMVGSPPDPTLRRHLHTLAGGGATVGAPHIAALAHAAENYFDTAVTVSAQDLITLLETVTLLEQELDRVEEPEPLPATAGLIQRLAPATGNDVEDAAAQDDWFEPIELGGDEDDSSWLMPERPIDSDALLQIINQSVALSEAPERVAGWYAEPVAELQQSLLVELREDLAALTGAAESAMQPGLAELALALVGVHDVLNLSEPPAPADADEFLEGHEALLRALDQVAMGERMLPSANVIGLRRLEARLAELVVADDQALPVAAAVPDAEEQLAAEPPTPALAESSATDEPATLRALDVVLPDDADADLLAVFAEEADELCEALEQSVSAWAADPEDAIYIERILRSLHTFKGGARLAGMNDLAQASHEWESELLPVQAELLRQGQVGGGAPTQEFFTDQDARQSQLAAGVEAFKRLLDGGVPIHQGIAEAGSAQSAVVATDGAEPEIATEPGSTESKPRANAGQDMVRVASGLLDQLIDLTGETGIARTRLTEVAAEIGGALNEMATTVERVRDQVRRLEIETEAQVLFRAERAERPGYEEFDPLEMDRYSQLQQLARSLGESASDLMDLEETLQTRNRESETLLAQQARLHGALADGLTRSRMVPFERMVPRLKRIARQVGTELGKPVQLITGEATGDLDRSVLERMVAPLEHMLRNAIDHGLESPAERAASGKPEQGRVEIALRREGSDIVVDVSDDGAGIDVERVREKAVAQGLLSDAETATEREILQCIFAPGFSTAGAVTQISGRGVGMDVVFSEVRQLGGGIEVASEPGKGTAFTIRLPFTATVNRALMVTIGEETYALPLNSIEGIVRAAPDELAALYENDEPSFEYAGSNYELMYVGGLLGRRTVVRRDALSLPVILVRAGQHVAAVHVDSVQGSREIVVKSLGPQFASVDGLSGATVLGDGSVVVILDLPGLLRRRQNGPLPTVEVEEEGERRLCVMVVDDSLTMRKVTSRVLERRGMDVLLAKDGVDAVAMLNEVSGRQPDLMLLDIEMPRMDGFEVARQVRHDDRYDGLPIIMISSRSGRKHRDRARELGVDEFLGKPFQESDLLATIGAVMGQEIGVAHHA